MEYAKTQILHPEDNHLLPKSGMSGAKPLFPQCTFNAGAGKIPI